MPSNMRNQNFLLTKLSAVNLSQQGSVHLIRNWHTRSQVRACHVQQQQQDSFLPTLPIQQFDT